MFKKKKKDHLLPGSLNLHNAGFLNREHVNKMLSVIDRYERLENPHVYLKAIRATLLSLGFGVDWDENEFRDQLEDYFKEN